MGGGGGGVGGGDIEFSKKALLSALLFHIIKMSSRQGFDDI